MGSRDSTAWVMRVWVGDVGGMDGDAEEGVGAQGCEEELVPCEAYEAAPGGADAPAEGLGMMDSAGGEMGDGLEAGGVLETEVAHGSFGFGVEEPRGGDEAGGLDAGALGEFFAATEKEREGVCGGDVEEFAFAGGVDAGDEAGAGGFVRVAGALVEVAVEDGLVAGGDAIAQPWGKGGIGVDGSAVMVIRHDQEGGARDADGGECGEDGGNGRAGEG